MINTHRDDLTAMVEGYLRCALWSTPFSNEDGDMLETPFGSEDSTPLTDIFDLSSIIIAVSDCYDFCQYVEEKAEETPDHHPGDGAWLDARGVLYDMDPVQCGRDFWLTREGHGAGFWDRGLGDAGERLSDAARTFGGGDLTIIPDSNPDSYSATLGG